MSQNPHDHQAAQRKQHEESQRREMNQVRFTIAAACLAFNPNMSAAQAFDRAEDFMTEAQGRGINITQKPF